MLCRVSRILLYLLVILHYSCTLGKTSLPEENENLPESAALQMCIDSFDIHEDKIIRTQDSEEMGAKYLNEVDLDSRQECLRVCCETNDCDVFIFEEKKPGSCYLFHCGPPHDFKCKFTSHANYSTAVLTNINYHNTALLEEQIRRTQQEHELKSLRKLADPAPMKYSYTEAPPVPITEALKTSVLTTPLPIKTGCSRNQYECRTSGDCIAIYNVCDGILQCADGSDEASELSCPTEIPTIPTSPALHGPLVPQTSEILKYPPVIPHHKSNTLLHGNERENPPKFWQLPVAPHQIMPPQPNAPYLSQQGALSLPRINYGSQGYIGGWDYREMYEQNKEANFVAANQLHAKNELSPYEQDQPRIFKHKSAGAVAQSAVPEGLSYIDSNRPYSSYYPLQNHGTWQDGEPQVPSHSPQPSPSFPPEVQNEQLTATEQQPKSTTRTLPCNLPSMQLAKDSPKPSSNERKNHEMLKAFHMETAKNQEHTKAAVHESTQDSRVKTRVDKTQDHQVQHNNKSPEVNHQGEVRIHHFVAEHLQQNNHRTSAEVLKPKGAVISLALGLIATAIMAALIACRLRVVRRRGRRGHGPYAHDADYLVNGMYL